AGVKQSDYGYRPRVSGGAFLPLHREGRMETVLFGGPPPARSDVMAQIVRRGARAVPHLLAHLGDRRPTGVVITHGGTFGFMGLNERADRNPRTQEPERESDEPAEPLESFESGGFFQGTRHTVTVGDLGYVALGQIVNRRFDAVRYQPTAII